ncbi:MAG: ABC transporter substrate-binding protein [Anaerolineae bacterium]|nr:ABC transporter substrate-binding protein [Anaerolineae bacterium]
MSPSRLTRVWTATVIILTLGLLAACAQPQAAPAPAPAAQATTAPAAAQPTTAPAAQPTTAPAAQPTTAAATQATAAPAAKAATSGDPGAKATLIYGMGADPTNLDPHQTVDGLSLIAMNRCYDRLVEVKPGEPKPGAPLEVQADAAESWDVSADGKTYTFKLRKGLKFADGSPLDAQAVKASFDRLMAINKSAASNIRQLTKTDAVDDVTVKMTLSEPYPYFLPMIGSYASSIINPKAFANEKDGDKAQAWLANNCMGSGPYVISEWTRGQRLVLDYNKNWYGKEPAIKRVIVKIVPESTNLLLQLEKGDLDFMSPVSIPEMLTLQGKAGVKMVEVPSFLLILAYLNNTKPPLDNVKVRQAMNYAINYDQVIKELIQGKGRRLKGPLAFGMEGYDESLAGYNYDPAKAKQLLTEAGYPNGFEITLTYATQGAPGADDIAQAAAAYLGEVGIKVKIEKVAEPTRRERIDKSDFVWSVGGWTPPVPIPPWTMDKWYLCANRGLNANRAFYCNQKADELVTKAATEVDSAKRIQMYRDAQKIMVEEAPYILFYQANQLIAYRDNLEGFEIKPGGSQYLSYERLSKK